MSIQFIVTPGVSDVICQFQFSWLQVNWPSYMYCTFTGHFHLKLWSIDINYMATLSFSGSLFLQMFWNIDNCFANHNEIYFKYIYHILRCD
jgi:hypothetical protein